MPLSVRFTFLLIVFLGASTLFPLQAHATGPWVDSLERILEVTSNPLDRMELLDELIYETYRDEKDRADDYYHQLKAIVDEIASPLAMAKLHNANNLFYIGKGDFPRIEKEAEIAIRYLEGTQEYGEFARSYYYLGGAAFGQGNYEIANEQLTQALDFLDKKKDAKWWGNCMVLKASVLRRMGRFNESLELAFDALQVYQRLGYDHGVVRAYISIGNVQLDNGDVEKARETYNKVVELATPLGMDILALNGQVNLGVVYLNKSENHPDSLKTPEAIEQARIQNLALAEKHFKEGLAIAEVREERRIQVFLLNKLAQTLLSREKLDSALVYAIQSTGINQLYPDKNQLALSHLLIGNIYLEQGNSRQGFRQLEQGLKLAEKIKAHTYLELAYSLMAKHHAQLGNFEMAYDYRTKQYQLLDSAQERESKADLEKLKASKETSRQAEVIQDLQNEKEQSSFTRLILLASLAAAILLGGMAFLLYRVRSKSKFAKIMERKNAEIEAQNRHLALYSSDLEQFAFIVSHNLKEPLRNIGSFTGLIQRKYGARIEEDGRMYMDFVINGVAHMNKLLSNLLIYVQLEKSKEAFQPVNMDQVVKLLEREMENEFQERNARIYAPNLPVVQAKPKGIHLLFRHLIDNALKFGNGESIEIEIRHRKKKGYHSFTIKDNGIGMKEEFMGKIFDVFQRLHTQDNYPGTGIGLAICRKVVQQHNGTIEVTSTPGVGTTFEVNIPAIT
ncbi:MAG: ATP-binding protein [Bacteroidota bacterium]